MIVPDKRGQIFLTHYKTSNLRACAIVVLDDRHILIPISLFHITFFFSLRGFAFTVGHFLASL